MECFALARVSGLSQADAYRKCYNSSTTNENSVHRKAYDVEHHPLVMARIQELRGPIVEEVQLTLKNHLLELERLKALAEQNGKIEAAIKAEKHRGEASGLYVSKVDANVNGNVTVEIVRYGKE
ncbi:MAG TPA: hypothetical protein VFM18_20725 [Methanosarcina sp.]|nr:hypothetical protein [Methanosarcina sp.]